MFCRVELGRNVWKLHWLSIEYQSLIYQSNSNACLTFDILLLPRTETSLEPTASKRICISRRTAGQLMVRWSPRVRHIDIDIH